MPTPLLAYALLVPIALAALATPAHAQDDREPAPTRSTRTGFSLTVYSSADPATFDPKQAAEQGRDNPGFRLPGYGLVRDERKIDLKDGINTVRFVDVAAGIDPTTVKFTSTTDPAGTSVVEQDFAFDLVGADKLLRKYVGELITVQPRGQAPFRATLLAAEPGSLVLREGNGQVRVVPRGAEPPEINLPALPSGLITRPTLIWKVQAQKAGAHDVSVAYQTDGLTWRADYNLTLAGDEKTMDLGAWVTLLNESGASYPDARLKLVAGDVQRIQPPRPMYRADMMMEAAPAAAPAVPGFEEKSFFEYHLYTLGRPTSLADRSTKQIELFPAKAKVPAKKVYVYYGLAPQFRGLFFGGQPNLDRSLGTVSETKVDVTLEVKNSDENGLGVPLPAGRVRVSKRDDADGALEFVGEDVIPHTAKNEDVRVKLGSAFDVVGERKQADFRGDQAAHWIDETYQITLRNQKAEPVRVIVKENLFRWTNWEISRTTDAFTKEDSRTVHFAVDVPAGGSKVVTYTVRYTW